MKIDINAAVLKKICKHTSVPAYNDQLTMYKKRKIMFYVINFIFFGKLVAL